MRTSPGRRSLFSLRSPPKSFLRSTDSSVGSDCGGIVVSGGRAVDAGTEGDGTAGPTAVEESVVCVVAGCAVAVPAGAAAVVSATGVALIGLADAHGSSAAGERWM